MTGHQGNPSTGMLLDGTQIADDLGNARVMNSVLIGALSTLIDVSQDQWLEVLLQRVPSKAVELNRKAFLAGTETINRLSTL